MESQVDHPSETEGNQCHFCGQYHPVEAQFCPVTGQTLSQVGLTCPSCGQEVNEDWVRCPHCTTMLQSRAGQFSRRQNRQTWFLLPIVILGLVIVSFGIGLFWVAGKESNGDIDVQVDGSPRLPTEHPSLLGTDTTVAAVPQFTASWTPQPAKTTPLITKTMTSRSSPYASLTPSVIPGNGPWNACPGSYLSRIHVNDQAYVALDPPLANRVRAEPGRAGTVIGRIQPGEEMTILDGPACRDGWIWWKVQADKTNLVGWTAEGDSESYWLIPLP